MDWEAWLSDLFAVPTRTGDAWPEPPASARAASTPPAFAHGAPEPGGPMSLAPRTEAATGKREGGAARLADLAPVLPAMEGEESLPLWPRGPVGPTGNAIQRASLATGVPARYLDALTAHESGGDSHADNPESSALGIAQFLDGPWLDTTARHGARYGMREGLSRADILELRRDDLWSALMVAEQTRENASVLRAEIGRDPRENELYLAHFLGPRAAASLIRAQAEDRNSDRRARSGASVVGEKAAQANRNVFYDGSRARSASEVIERQSARFTRETFVAGERAQPANQTRPDFSGYRRAP